MISYQPLAFRGARIVLQAGTTLDPVNTEKCQSTPPSLPSGSIAFGSLIVTPLEILGLIPNAARNNVNASGSRKSALAQGPREALLLNHAFI
ncbi:hypothetical protein BV22DRAFT_1027841 [Leucogyrophana mollusca]|uniref:Uncharacterized protein n=1 Tax=Leucogyrophana mollusca TaxID=85980 RepID=A0ACB8C1R9_9AGAM|nr:hypothetical protein BV22DRAFT_1027841 [Leucogyrophana mollusca]